MSTATKQDRVDILGFWNQLRRNKQQLIAYPLTAAVACYIIFTFVPKSYRSEAVILPISSQDSSGLLSASTQNPLSSLVGLLSNSGGAGGIASTFISILKSRTLTQTIIEKLQLLPVMYPKIWDKESKKWTVPQNRQPQAESEAKGFLKDHVVVEQDKILPVITIKVSFADAELSTKITNAYVEELQNFINTKAFTISKKKRMFIGEQLLQMKKNSLISGKNLSTFYQNNKVSDETGSLDVSLTKESEDLSQAHKQEYLGKIPQKVYYNYLRMESERNTELVNLLSTQYELAKIDESKTNLNFQIVDQAIVPRRPYFPNKPLFTILAFMITFFSMAFYCYFKVSYQGSIVDEVESFHR